MSGSTSIPAIPTLGAETFISDPSQKIAYILRHFASVPKSASNTYYDLTNSLVDILSNYGSVSTAVSQPIITALSFMLNRVFGGQGALITVEVDIVPVTDTTYSIVISIQVTLNGIIYSTNPSAQVINGVLSLANDSVTLPPVTATNLANL